MDFELVGPIEDIQTIAVGPRILELVYAGGLAVALAKNERGRPSSLDRWHDSHC